VARHNLPVVGPTVRPVPKGQVMPQPKPKLRHRVGVIAFLVIAAAPALVLLVRSELHRRAVKRKTQES
jgi:hypothetical protein